MSYVVMLYPVILLHELIPAGQVWLHQHVRGVGRWSQQVGKQHRHLEVLSWTLLQNLGALRCASPAAVVQTVSLTVRWGDGGYVESVREVAINRRQRKMEERNKVSFIICLKKRKIGLVEEVLGVFVCLCPHLILLIITFETRFPVVIQTSLCGET